MVTLLFNDNKDIKLSTSSFLYKNSRFLQAFDLDEDTTLRSGANSAGNVINILCPSSYITNNDICYFNDEINLSFVFTLKPYKFINLCKFLDIICYENKDNAFSKEFITYVIDSIYIKKHINEIQYFMQPEIRSIMNYINNEDINLQIKSCTPTFYFLYLNEYKEYVIKHNRRDIYELSTDKSEYYRYIHKYDNQLTYNVKETREYNEYISNINMKVYRAFITTKNLDNITELIEQGADINYQLNSYTILHYMSNQIDNIKNIQYLVEHGANVNIQNIHGYTALHYTSNTDDNLEVVQYLVEHGANIRLKNNKGETALQIASQLENNEEVIDYLMQFN